MKLITTVAAIAAFTLSSVAMANPNPKPAPVAAPAPIPVAVTSPAPVPQGRTNLQMLLANPLVIAGVIATAVAIPVAIHNAGKDEGPTGTLPF